MSSTKLTRLAKPARGALAVAGLVAAVASFPAGPGFADEGWTVRDITVNADLTAIASPESAGYWATITPDLKAAIAGRVADRAAPDGVEITVDLVALEISDTATTALADGQSRLAGTVEIREPDDPMAASRDNDAPIFRNFGLDVRVDTAAMTLPPDTDLAMMIGDSEAYYRALVDAFARVIVEHLE